MSTEPTQSPRRHPKPGHSRVRRREADATFWETADPADYPSVETILDRIDPPLGKRQAHHVREAYAMAREAHAGQKRRSGDPYFSHCAEVALLLADLVTDWPTLAAALLHDTIEDCGLTKRHIDAHLPEPVGDLVDGVTKISSLNFSSDREHQANNLRKMIVAMARDVRVVLIKLCDRLHNMRTLEFLAPEKQKAIATATIEIYAPLANRLGMETIRHELEDLSMKYLHPTFYRQLSGHLERNAERYNGIIHRTREVLEGVIGEARIEAEVSGRLKHIYSIYRKMLRMGLNLMEIHDLIAMRVITETLAETYEVLGLVHSKWKPVEGRFKDYIASPKPNGYQSIHTTVIGNEGELIEIQIRTREMHRIASEGAASYWKYKEAGSERSPEAMEARHLAWLRQLVETLSDIRDPQEFMAAIKHDVFDDSVFCYTPQGDVIEMPRNSTLLDFAYRVHTEVGHHCAGAKLNHKMAPLRTRLKTGDIAEIITNNSAHPTRDWVQIARTGRARNKIRHWLKTHDREHYLARGREALLAELRSRAPGAKGKEILAALDGAAEKLSFPGAKELLVEIGFGSVKPGMALSKIDHPALKPAVQKPPSAKARKSPEPGTIVVEGVPGVLTRLALCCSPVPPDPIVGFVTQGRGISVHRADCVQFKRSKNIHADSPNRLIAVGWSEGDERLLRVAIRVVCQDRQGLLKDIIQGITNQGISIIDSASHSNLRTNSAIIKMTVLVANEDALNMLLRRLETIPSVRSLSRVIHRH